VSRNTEDQRHLSGLRLFNPRDCDLTFVLEPWGESYCLRPGDVCDLEFAAAGPGYAEVDFAEDVVTVSGWAGSTVRVFLNGEELGAGSFERTPVPASQEAEE
jgi:hypothetical protein